MTNVCIKFEKAGPYQTLAIDQTRWYTMDAKADGQTDGQKGAKQYTPSSSKWGIIKNRDSFWNG